jgi:hypothetical protein
MFGQDATMNIGAYRIMQRATSRAMLRTMRIVLVSSALCAWGVTRPVQGVEAPLQAGQPPAIFDGAKSAWHGFDHYDFLMDEENLAKAGVPLLHVCGSLDPWLDTQTRVVEKRYNELGGQITVIVQEGDGHYPLAPKDAKPVLDFITKNVH